MPQSLANLVVHIVYSTKNRHPFLRDHGLREEMFRQLGGVSKTLDCGPLIVGGMEDHVHILARQARTISLADWIKELKRITSLWIKERILCPTATAASTRRRSRPAQSRSCCMKYCSTRAATSSKQT